MVKEAQKAASAAKVPARTRSPNTTSIELRSFSSMPIRIPSVSSSRHVLRPTFQKMLELRPFPARFFELRFWIAVRHDAPAGEIVRLLAADGEQANRHREAKRTVVGDRPEGARVKTAPHRFEPSDDFHGPNFRRSRHAAARKHRPEQVELGVAGVEPGADDGETVVNGPVRLHDRRAQEPHRTGRGDPAEVVTFDIQDHGELCIFFGTFVELSSETRVVDRVGAARTGPLDGGGLYLAAASRGEEEFRRARADGHPSEVEARAERCRRAVSERRIKVERRSSDFEPEPARQVDLVEIAGSDELLGEANAFDVSLRWLTAVEGSEACDRCPSFVRPKGHLARDRVDAFGVVSDDADCAP